MQERLGAILLGSVQWMSVFKIKAKLMKKTKMLVSV